MLRQVLRLGRGCSGPGGVVRVGAAAGACGTAGVDVIGPPFQAHCRKPLVHGGCAAFTSDAKLCSLNTLCLNMVPAAFVPVQRAALLATHRGEPKGHPASAWRLPGA